MKRILVVFVGVVAVSTWIVAAQKGTKKSASPSPGTASSAMTDAHKLIVNPSDLRWGEMPPGLLAGAKMAVLYGDPGKGGAFTVRMNASAGYTINPHTHPTAERLTVVTGRFRFGMGEKVDEASMQELGPGGYVVLPSGMA